MGLGILISHPSAYIHPLTSHPRISLPHKLLAHLASVGLRAYHFPVKPPPPFVFSIDRERNQAPVELKPIAVYKIYAHNKINIYTAHTSFHILLIAGIAREVTPKYAHQNEGHEARHEDHEHKAVDDTEPVHLRHLEEAEQFEKRLLRIIGILDTIGTTPVN